MRTAILFLRELSRIIRRGGQAFIRVLQLSEREVAHSISGNRTSYVPLWGEWIRRLPLRCHLWPRCVFLSEQCPNEWAYASATLEMSGITDRYSNVIEVTWIVMDIVTWIVAFDM